jgi:hypothetical protein
MRRLGGVTTGPDDSGKSRGSALTAEWFASSARSLSWTHVGNTLTATTGASLKELMARMGHASTRAALIYQHASQDRDKGIAEALGDAFEAAHKGTKKRSGTQRVRKRKKAG